MKNYLETFNQVVKDAQESPDGYAVMVIDPPKREEQRPTPTPTAYDIYMNSKDD